MVRPMSWYDTNAQAVSERYAEVPAASIHGWLINLLPARPANGSFNVGAGSGRDGVWLSDLGYDVVAVEPSP
jgi:protein-L-isoaspartate O-methyltransferase